MRTSGELNKEKVKELGEWKEASHPTGICETCTEISIQLADRYREALEKINDICKVDCDVCGFKNTRNCYGSECDEHKVNDILEISRRVLENN